MSGRSWFRDGQNHSPGMVDAAFGFITTNIGTNPNPANFFGCGGLTGGDGSGAANTGPSFIKSIVKTANNGEFLVTLTDGYRKVWHADAVLYGPAAGPNGGDWAQVSVPSNEGLGSNTPVTFLVTTFNTSNVAVETTGRRVSCSMRLKDLGVGA